MTNEEAMKAKPTEDFALHLWYFMYGDQFRIPDKNSTEVKEIIEWLKSEAKE